MVCPWVTTLEIDYGDPVTILKGVPVPESGWVGMANTEPLPGATAAPSTKVQ